VPEEDVIPARSQRPDESRAVDLRGSSKRHGSRLVASAIVAFIAMFGAIGTARADPPPTDAPALTTGNDGTTDTSTQTDANAQAGQTDASNTNVNARVDEPGANGDVTQSNGTSADATAKASSTSGTPDAQGTSDATQDTPTNVNLAVRVNSPGVDGSVSQTNDASASATTTASAAQVSPSNINVSVRIASPGDSATVSQANTAAAQTTDPSAPTITPPLDPDALVSNTSTIDQMLGECTAVCPALPFGEGSAQPSTLSRDGTASQTSTAAQGNPTNANIAIRIGSPGHDQGSTQVNTSNAATATTTGENNVNVIVSLPGTNVVVPVGSDSWTWNWTWTLDTTPAVTDAQTDSGSWSWTWTPEQSAPAPQTSVNGRWLWTWTWSDSNGVGSSFTYDQPCTCSWVWNWSWSGEPAAASAPPAAEAPTPTAPVDAPSISQTNTVTTSANATATLDATQETDGSAIAQTMAATQLAQADAQATQTRANNLNVVTAGSFGGVDQSNALAADAAAAVGLTVTQAAAQSDGANASASQTIALTQTAHATATAAQVDTQNRNVITSSAPTSAQIGAVEQTTEGLATAAAGSTATIVQIAFQAQDGTGAHSATLAQTTTLAQLATASAQVSQTRVGNVSDVLIPAFAVSNPALAQRNELRASAASFNSITTRQMTTQASSNDSTALLLELEATQQADVRQSGDAGSGQAQADRQNLAHWNGIVHKPESPAAEQAAAAAAPVPPATWVTSTAGSPRVELRAGLPPLGAAQPDTKRTRYLTVVLGAQIAALPLAAAAATRSGSITPAAETAGRPHAARHAEAAARSSSDRAPLCLPCEPTNLFGAIEGARQAGSAGVVVALSRFRLFAPSGAGRVRHDAPALGSPVDIAPDERPG
jgi:hypothetical protein